jgi:hypothetical protein
METSAAAVLVPLRIKAMPDMVTSAVREGMGL